MKTQEKNSAVRHPEHHDIPIHDEQPGSFPAALTFLLVVIGAALVFVAAKLFGIV
jgi:hypothetical protein